MTRIMSDTALTLRYHALKKIKDREVKVTIPWLWTISMRHQDLWPEVMRLSCHSCWQLIQAQLRPQSLTRQPLAKQLQQML